MKRKNKRILLKIFLILILISLPALFNFVLKSPMFLVRNIIITTDYDISANQELVKILERTKDQNIFLVNEKELAEKIKSTDIKIKEVRVQKRFPGKILVEIESRQALAAIPSGEKFFLVDKEGLVFAEEKEARSLPILNLGLQNIGVGSRIDERNGKTALIILDSLKGKEEIVSITVISEEIQMQFREGSLVLFPVSDEINAKINALQMILKRLRIEGRKPSKIDLRFEKPVVSF
ncbi:FtsQ-type POTRA domain-containing protein [Candidatus Gottesmanbacteria bacterium]|nr:FtsQ-type POTRA domain-containing protein [Candidatus Gottesmanbacteria bacterium]